MNFHGVPMYFYWPIVRRFSAAVPRQRKRNRCVNHPRRDFTLLRPKRGYRIERRRCKRCGELLSVRQVKSK